MKMNTYVNFSGNCAEAFRYYGKHLGANVGKRGPSRDAESSRARADLRSSHKTIEFGEGESDVIGNRSAIARN